MFDHRKTLITRFADAADLLIDFATLGEYGLEPVEAPCRTAAECRPGRRRRRAPRQPRRWHPRAEPIELRLSLR
jgi:hypothetical protein